MKVTKIYVASHRGSNKLPGSGDVWFDDGKSYGWCRSQHNDEITFIIPLKETSFRHFRSQKRADAVRKYLDF